VGAALAVSAGPVGDDFCVRFIDVDAVEQMAPLPAAWGVRFERVRPVREFVSFRGQRNFPGLWWSATTGAHVGYESWLERDWVMLLDFDSDVVGLASQPFWLSWSVSGRRRRHAPDIFARLRDGTGIVVDVRPDDRIDAEDAEVFAATARACDAAGWGYRRVGAVDPVLLANVRWLAGYRHPRFGHGERAELLRGVFTTPRRLSDGVAAAGERLAALPVLFHLLWSGVLVNDLAAAPLGPDSVITAGGLSA